MEMLYKIFTPQVTKLDADTYRVTLTTEAVDRQGMVVRAKGVQMDNYLRNPVVMYAHDYGALPIGSALTVEPADRSVDATFKFAPPGTYEFADTVHRLWDAGVLRAVSIGFIPLEWEQDGKTVASWELLEFSIVPIPANQEALRRILDPLDVEVREGRVLSRKNREIIQNALTSMKQAIKTLEMLLRATEPAKDEPDDSADDEPDDDEGEQSSQKRLESLSESLRQLQEALHG